MNEETALVPVDEQPPGAIQVYQERTIDDLVNIADKLGELQRRVFKDDVHFGIIPGTNKPTLLKPGAELMCLLFRLTPEYKTEKIFEGDHLTVITTCTLRHIESQAVWGSGEGMCSTKESKYAYRKASIKCPKCEAEAVIKGKEEYGGGWLCWKKNGGCGAKWKDGDQAIEGQERGRTPNPDLPDQYNTVLKMSNKRAYVDATIKATGASNSFTQDMEDNPGGGSSGSPGDNSRPPQSQAPPPQETPPPATTGEYIQPELQQQIHIRRKEKEIPDADLRAKLKELTGEETTACLTNEHMPELWGWIDGWKAPAKKKAKPKAEPKKEEKPKAEKKADPPKEEAPQGNPALGPEGQGGDSSPSFMNEDQIPF